jgi:hypothetical protein
MQQLCTIEVGGRNQVSEITKQKYDETDWRHEFMDEEFIVHPRIPHHGWSSIETLLLDSQTPKIFLREKKTHTDVVLRFPTSSYQLPDDVRHVQSTLGMGMEAVFSERLWKRPRIGSTLWSELLRVGYKAYSETWFHYQTLLYLDHFHPIADASLRKDFLKMQNAAMRSVGRRRAAKQEILSTRKRYKELLRDCQEIHLLVQECKLGNMIESDVRKAIFARIHGRRFDSLIFRKQESVFDDIREFGDKTAQLHLPDSWKPTQMAIAIVALERDFKYKTIEKATAAIRIKNAKNKKLKLNK